MIREVLIGISLYYSIYSILEIMDTINEFTFESIVDEKINIVDNSSLY